MLLNLNKQIKNIDGSEIPGESGKLSFLLSQRIGLSSIIPDPVKFWAFAESLRDTGEVSLDSSDAEKMEKFISDDKEILCFAKAQLLKELKKEILLESEKK